MERLQQPGERGQIHTTEGKVPVDRFGKFLPNVHAAEEICIANDQQRNNAAGHSIRLDGCQEEGPAFREVDVENDHFQPVAVLFTNFWKDIGQHLLAVAAGGRNEEHCMHDGSRSGGFRADRMTPREKEKKHQR